MRKFNVKVNGKSFFVEVEEQNDGIELVSSAPVVSTAAQTTAPIAMPQKAAAKPSAPLPTGGVSVKSPMPGLILSLTKANGDTVKKGDKIIVLEAIKMENDIVASADGVITYVVKKGDSVETDAVLATIA